MIELRESAVVGPPVASPTRQAARKFLVVKASYTALTSRVDANVMFWDREATQTASIPKGVTDIWLSPSGDDLSPAVRSNLARQAIERGIVIHKMPLKPLLETLYPVWAEDRNRSLLKPKDASEEQPDSPSAKIASGDVSRHSERLSRNAELRAAWRRYARTGTAKVMDGRSIRAAIKRQAPPAAPAPDPPASVPAPPVPAGPGLSEALSAIPVMEANIFRSVHGLNGKPGVTPATVAKDLVMPETRIMQILDMAWSRIQQKGYQGPRPVVPQR